MFKNGTGEMYKLIILDYSLGGDMNGPDVSRQIRRMIGEVKGLRHPYICCCTAY